MPGPQGTLNVLISTPPDANGKLISVIWMTRELLKMQEIIRDEKLPIRLHCVVEEEFIDLDNEYNRRMLDAGFVLHPLPATPRRLFLLRHLLRCLLGQLSYPFLADRNRLNAREISYFYKRYRFLKHLVGANQDWILHAHSPDLGMPELIALKRLRSVPLIVTLHGEGQRREMEGSKRGYWGADYERRFRRAIPYWDLVLFVSEDYRKNLAYLNIDPAKSRVVYNGVNAGEFYSTGERKDSHEIKVLCFSELDSKPLRGLHYVIPAAQEIVRRCKQIRFSVIYGRNSKEYVDQPLESPMGKLVLQLGLSDHFRFFSWIDPRHINGFINEHDIVLHPTFADACSNFVLEGMACGKPIIATRGCGNDEMIDDRNGILVEYATLKDDLVKAVLRLAASPTLRTQMGTASRKKVNDFFNVERESRECLGIYQEISAGWTSRQTGRQDQRDEHAV